MPTDSNKILITGGNGQLATELALVFSTHGWQVNAPGHEELDVTDRTAVLEAVEGIKPHAVINAAAWTNPVGCDEDPARAWAIHAMAVRHLAEACRNHGAYLCQISTDYVFDGSPNNSHTEWDRPAPTCTYGQSKLGGELEVPDGHTIVRTSRLISHHGNNVGRNVLRLATTNRDQEFKFDAHHKGCVTFTADLAEVIHTLVTEHRPGIYHVTNSGPHTWFEFVQTMLAQAGLDPNRVGPLPTDTALPGPIRPEYSVLENVALAASGISPPGPWCDSLEKFIASASV